MEQRLLERLLVLRLVLRLLVRYELQFCRRFWVQHSESDCDDHR
jgi:hypothetical protein